MAPTAAVSASSFIQYTHEERRVIFASSLGTVFEWYDFYLYGALASIISARFFSGLNPTAAFIFALMAFAAGFAVRPFGALVFGRLGDLVGRKYTFLVTILIMGTATCMVGVLPDYSAIGPIAPFILVGLRLLQGLALGGEYGGAATYVAEHAPDGKRGAYTSWIQTTASVGLCLALLVILGIRTVLGESAFADWGWRIPFLLSAILLVVSVWIRLKLRESPVFQQIKNEGRTSKAPLTEAFGRWSNLKIVIVALLGLTAGQAVVWYTGQFYALFFLTQTLMVDDATANLMVAAALLIGMPFFIVFGTLSDHIGRKVIIMTGLLLAATTYFPLFAALTHYANPALEQAQARAPVVVVADPRTCTFLFNPVSAPTSTSSCDIAKGLLARSSVSYVNQAAPHGAIAEVRIGKRVVASYEADELAPAVSNRIAFEFRRDLGDAIKAAGYPARADPSRINHVMVIGVLVILMIYVTMVYGPIAALLVELFPTRIRYSSMSLPYHLGNGWFGGFLPSAAFAMVAATGDIYYGLWYPVAVAAATFVIGVLFVREAKGGKLRN